MVLLVSASVKDLS